MFPGYKQGYKTVVVLNLGKMEEIISIIISIANFALPIIISIAAIAIAIYSFLISRRALVHQVLIDVQYEYRKPEMLYALRRLWNVYDKCLEDKKLLGKKSLSEEEKKDIIKMFQDEYEKQYNVDDKSLFEENDAKKLNEKMKFTLDNQRRIVSHYFQHLYDLYQNNILIKKKFLKSLSTTSLITIEDICIPLEIRLIDIISKKRPGDSKNKNEGVKKLKQFVSDFRKYKKDC